ncbi:MAG TPA: DUF4173 domain-containing protein [Allosphingosinicella sp.]|nr:DUF4173 domain-containing protein [Allosphingosinicella sp.]
MADKDGTPRRAVRDWSFLHKLIGTLALAGIAQGLFVFQRGGSTIGGFALLLLLVVVLLRPLLWRNRGARLALAAAGFFALVLAADPGFLALLLYWTMLTLAVLLTRAGRFGNGWRWVQRMMLHGVLSPFAPLRDLVILNRTRSRRAGGFGRIALALVLPVLGTILFLALFAAANPLIENFLIRIDATLSAESVARLIFAGFIFLAVWSLLRPPRLTFGFAGATPPLAAAGPLPGVTPASVTLSLIAFNLVFAVQNGLDIAFLWSGAPLPGDLTLAGYAHRGAYPLIATALLAALFVLVTLRPGSDTARSRGVALLVTLWIAQNLLLVASTIYRTVDYIESYSLTVLRISALIWMGLVAIGLVLVCYRLLRGKSGAWLINANMLAALLVLGASTCVDLGGVAAGWNVRHAREVGGRGVQLDFCYLRELGPSALLPLLELESRPGLPAAFRGRVTALRARLMDHLEVRQADWHGWTLRGATHLAAARSIVEQQDLPTGRGSAPDCSPQGVELPPRPVVEMNAVDANLALPEENGTAAPLTENAAR